MQVYFARSIRGHHSKDDALYFQTILDTIKACGHVPALETKAAIRLLNHVDHNRSIYERDIEWLSNSQVMIAEVSNPSLGVGYEIAYAAHVLHIPILAVAYKDTNVSAMIQGSLDVFYYRDTADLTAEVQEFLTHIGGS